MEVKDIIRNRRLELDLTLEQIAQRVGVSKPTVMRWENGDIENMRADKIAKLAKALNTTPVYLMGWTSDPLLNTIEDVTSSFLNSSGLPNQYYTNFYYFKGGFAATFRL